MFVLATHSVCRHSVIFMVNFPTALCWFLVGNQREVCRRSIAQYLLLIYSFGFHEIKFVKLQYLYEEKEKQSLIVVLYKLCLTRFNSIVYIKIMITNSVCSA